MRNGEFFQPFTNSGRGLWGWEKLAERWSVGFLYTLLRMFSRMNYLKYLKNNSFYNHAHVLLKKFLRLGVEKLYTSVQIRIEKIR